MSRLASLSGSDVKSAISRTSQLSFLDDDECKRILEVVERDFKIREQEYKRLDAMKKQIKQENEQIQYLAGSQDFNGERCIRCFKPFKFLFNPKETCAVCSKYVCHDCATFSNETKSWACKACTKLKELEILTADWFYQQSSRKHKRCGSAKIIRELHKREVEIAEQQEIEEDRRYGINTDQLPIDKTVKVELKEYARRLEKLVEKLQDDLGERNAYTNNRSIKGKSKETLKEHQQQIKTEIARARVAVSGPLRRSNVKSNTTHERDLHVLLVQQTEGVLHANFDQFHNALIAPNSSINAGNFDQKLAQAIFDKCVSQEIFQELPDVIDSPTEPPAKPQRHPSTTSSLTSLTKQDLTSPSPRSSTASFEIKSHKDNIRKIAVRRNSTVAEEDFEKEGYDERESNPNTTNNIPIITTTESIEFDNGLKLDLSSIDDGDISDGNQRRRSIDYDYDAINRSNARVGDWQTNFTLIESKSTHSGEETPRSNRDSVFLTIPIADDKNLSPRVGDKPLEDLADDDLYADDQSSSYPIPINTATIADQSQISENDSLNPKKLFPLPANLILQNHSSCSFRRPSYTYESDNESITSSSISNLTDMKGSMDEEKFRMDPSITDPKFVLRPKDLIIRYGETAKFKVKVTGTEPVDVFWFRFGTDDELVNDEKYQLSHDDVYHYLKIYSTTKDDEGAYLCVIANDKAQNVDMAKLYVKDNKRSFTQPKILQEFIDTDVNEGSSLTLKCKIDQGYPKARVLWYKENTLIQPDKHYKLYYYGDGQHALNVNETTIEDDNGTFTCLALNAAGRAQITADVFVHEKEVIDIPRNSPTFPNELRNIMKRNSYEENSNMNNANNPPGISPPVSPITRTNENDREEQNNAKRFMDKFKNDRSSKVLENWQNLYEASVQTLENDDNRAQASPTEQPFYLNQHPSIENPLDERPRSPLFHAQYDPNSSKPKWEVTIPPLLNSTVGPDRQQRDPSRRHTTPVILQDDQQSSTFISQQKESKPYSTSEMSNDTNDNIPPSAIVKQLRQKFDRMIETNDQTQSQIGPSKIQRVGNDEGDGAYPLLPADENNVTDENRDDNEVASLTCRGLTSNNGERSGQKTRPMLPIRPLAETEPKKTRSTSIQSSSDNKNRTSEGIRNEKGKASPPISYQKSYNSPRSTTSVVKQLIGGGATLVYDSLSHNNNNSTPHTTSSLLQHHFYPNHQYQKQRQEHVRLTKSNLTNTTTSTAATTTNNHVLKVTQTQPKIDNTNNRKPSVNSDDDELNNQKYIKSTKNSFNRSTSMSDNISNPAKPMQTKTKQTSFDSITRLGRNTVLARAELWDRRISTNENETHQPVAPDYIQQWSNEFDKIQNQN